MNKKTGLYLMLAGAALSAWELAKPGAVYGAGKPLEKMRWAAYTAADGKVFYISISDCAALAGAHPYFR